MDKPISRAYRFGNFRVELQRREFTGPDGACLNRSARAYGVLAFDLAMIIGFLNSKPGLDSIRNEPRFRAVSFQLGLG